MTSRQDNLALILVESTAPTWSSKLEDIPQEQRTEEGSDSLPVTGLVSPFILTFSYEVYGSKLRKIGLESILIFNYLAIRRTIKTNSFRNKVHDFPGRINWPQPLRFGRRVLRPQP
jgi:hypothetical protein